jgi:hypothetical protein
MAAEQFITSAYGAIVSWTYILLTILLIVKIVQFFTGGSLFGIGGGDGGGGGGGRRPDDEDIGPPERKGHKPNRVYPFQGEHQVDRVHLWWGANPDDENVNYYWIERRRHARTPRGFSWNRNLFGNWRRVAYVSRNYEQANPFIDNESFRNDEGVVREWWNSLDPIVPDNDYEYRIRAVNSFGKGEWVYYRVSRPGANAGGLIKGRVVCAEPDPANPANSRVEHIHLALPLANDGQAQNIYNYNAHPIGLSHAVNANIGAVRIAQTLADAQGLFSLPIPRASFNQRIIIQSPAQGGRAQNNHPAGWPTDVNQITLTDAQRTFEFAIIPKLDNVPGAPNAIIIPHVNPNPHNTPRHPPFGMGPPIFANHPMPNVALPLDVGSVRNVPGNRFYHVFFYHFVGGGPGILTLNQLNNNYWMQNITVQFTRGGAPANPIYADNFYHPYPVRNSVMITIQFHCPPALAGGLPLPLAVFAFVSVQNTQLANPVQQGIDRFMIEHALLGIDREAAINAAGVLDFNWAAVMIN